MKTLLTELEEQAIVVEIHAHEIRTTGEIRIVITSKWILRPQRYAVKLFDRLGIALTADRNAALIVLFIRRRRFVIIGDDALAAAVSGDYWKTLSNSLTQNLRDGQPLLALTTAIHTLGQTQASRWPADSCNPDELPNDIIHD